MSGKFYITYEEPFAGRRFSNEQMEEVYRDMADKKEYPDFQTWMDDMLNSGVFEEVKTRTFLKKNTPLGTIQKQMIPCNDGFNIYTINENGTSYNGTIAYDLESAQAVEWKERGFVEIQ